MPRSATSSSIPALASPSIKRSNTGMVRSPSGLPSLARSTNTRNLAGAAAPGSPSPFARSTTSSNLRAQSPARVVSAASSKNRGFKLLHELQAKLKKTDTKLEKGVPKRNVSGPMPLQAAKRAPLPATSASTMTARAPHARVQALAGDVTTPTTSSNDKSSILSPWEMVGDEDTPLAQNGHSKRVEPESPLDPGYRAISQASQTSQKSTSSRLPARPGIPSPLATVNGLNKSTSRLPQRTPSRAGISNLNHSTRPPSRAGENNRPISPSMIPRPASSMMQTVMSSSRSNANLAGMSPSASTPVRSNSQHAHRTLGRGPPPKVFPGSVAKTTISASTSNPALRKSVRRSSVGTQDMKPSGLPQPRTPSRPVSMVVEGTPPPVPRIPSNYLRESKRGHEQIDRRKSLLYR